MKPIPILVEEEEEELHNYLPPSPPEQQQLNNNVPLLGNIKLQQQPHQIDILSELRNTVPKITANMWICEYWDLLVVKTATAGKQPERNDDGLFEMQEGRQFSSSEKSTVTIFATIATNLQG
jgi:hypothetical protein